MPISSVAASIGGVTALAYPSDDLTTYQVGTEAPAYQAALGDLLPAAGTEPPYFGLGVTRYTQWHGVISGATVVIKIMCSETDPNWLAGPGTQKTAGGITWTLTKCVGEQRLV